MSEILRCENIVKRYGSKQALNGLDLIIESGNIIGLLGPNGAGKTTLIKIINGLLTPTSGTVTIEGDAPGVKTKSKVSAGRQLSEQLDDSRADNSDVR